jgi:hypothetical protein
MHTQTCTLANQSLSTEKSRAAFVSSEVVRLGLSVAIEPWLQIAVAVRDFAESRRIIHVWPPVFIYPTGADACRHQLISAAPQSLLKQVEQARAWAVFESLHSYAKELRDCRDRSIIHAACLGGPYPITYTILHELAHHHLHQLHGEPYRTQHCHETTCTRLAMGWLPQIQCPHMESDDGSFNRALDILCNRRTPCQTSTSGLLKALRSSKDKTT